MTITRCLAAAVIVCMVATLDEGLGFSDPQEKQQSSTDRLTVAEFNRLHKKLTKMSIERVWSIPWHVSIREAREQAAREKKPLLLWCTNNGGTNPLGPC